MCHHDIPSCISNEGRSIKQKTVPGLWLVFSPSVSLPEKAEDIL